MPPLLKIKGNVAVLTCKGQENYFHWMFDVLFKYKAINDLGIPIDKYIIDTKHPYQVKIIKKLDIPPNKIISTHRRIYIEAENLITLTYPDNIKYLSNNEYLNFLKNSFISDCPDDKKNYEYIYIYI